MAMEGNQNRNDSAAGARHNFRGTARRTDPSRGQPNVPVLFRLKNLQRADSVSADSESTDQAATRSSDNPGNSQPNAVREPYSKTSPSREQRNSQPTPTTAAPTSPAVTPQPVAASTTGSGKHGVSNGFILLVVAILAAYAIGRSSNKTSEVATKPASTTTTAPSTSVAVSAPEKAAPLIPPELPPIVTTEVEPSESEKLAQLESKDVQSDSKSSNDTQPKQQLISFESFDKSKDSTRDPLPVPSMLTSSKSEESTSDVLTFGSDDNSSSPTEERSLSIDSMPAETEAIKITASEFDPKPTNDTTIAPPKSASSSNTVSIDDRPKVVATNVPEMDTAQLYEMRANYQSQLEALARARQVVDAPKNSPSTPNPPMQYVSAQTAVGGQATPTYTTPQTQGYGGGQANSAYDASRPQQTYVPNQINPGYETSQPNMNFGTNQPNTQYVASPYVASQSNPALGYGSSQTNNGNALQPSGTLQMNQPSQPSGYTPIGAQLSYPPSFPASAAPPTQTTQPYQPMFSAPPYDPSQGVQGSSFPQSPADQYRSMAPSYQPN